MGLLLEDIVSAINMRARHVSPVTSSNGVIPSIFEQKGLLV